MRAVKTVISAAGNLKRASPEANEEALLLRALQVSHDIIELTPRFPWWALDEKSPIDERLHRFVSHARLMNAQ